MVFKCDCFHAFQEQKQSKPLPNPKLYLAQKKGFFIKICLKECNKMQPTNPNAHTYVNGTDVKTHGHAVTHNTFLQ